jgi:UDPglucose 6-dehydrogenase
MASVVVVGAGYVGLVTATCLARLGQSVVVLEKDAGKVKALAEDRLPIREAGLQELWNENRSAGRLAVSADNEALASADFVFLAVGTPSMADGQPDMSQVQGALDMVAASRGTTNPIIVIKSTVPVGTSDQAAERLAALGWDSARVVSNPEFLREGRAVLDFLRPDRIVIGSDDPSAAASVESLYQALRRPVLTCSAQTAEMIKYASNVFLCTKVSFINELASLCETMRVDVTDVSRALELDPRMGTGYFEAGLGWGGSCLPKDIRALLWTASNFHQEMPLISSALDVNNRQATRVLDMLRDSLGGLSGATVGVLGLTFKPNCDDLRESPAMALVEVLLGEGCHVKAFDPVAMEGAAALIPDLECCANPYEVAEEADALVLASAWKDFDNLDFNLLRLRMRQNFFIDGRNAFPPSRMTQAGMVYLGIGRQRAVPVDIEADTANRVPEKIG